MAETGRSIPLFFFPNTFPDTLPNGRQVAPSIRFIAETPEFRAAFRADSVTVQTHGSSIRVHFAGSSADVTMEGAELLPGKVNFLIGDNSRNWKPGIPTYHKVLYRGLYQGVDLTYGGIGQRLKSEFTVASGADPGRIALEYEGADGVGIDSDGRLVVTAGLMELREEAPAMYQESAHGRIPVEGRYRLTGPFRVGFEIGEYDPSKPLVIDPVISYCTYLGGGAMGSVTSLAADGTGSVYAAGWTEALNFPIDGAFQVANGGGVDAFVAKLNATGTTLDYATYIGGRGDDRAAGIAVDSLGQAYVTGATSSPNFPLVSALRSTLTGSRTAFVLKLNAAGSALLYSTYLGGSNYDLGNAIAVDASGNAYIAGDTMSTDFPVLHAAQGALGGQMDSFVTKLTPAGAIAFSTFLGGAGNEHSGGIAVDGSGNSYVAGGTFSADFPVVGAIQGTNGGGQDAFITKIDAAGSALVYSTYLGGSGGTAGAPEQANAIAVDASGSAYVAGVTNSANFPATAGAFQPSYDGGQDAFVTKINAAGSALVYSSYLGGSSFDWASGIQVDVSGNAYVAGYTSSFDFPTVNGMQAGFNGLYDAFVSTFNAAGSALTFSTYYGGSGADTANAIALDSSGGIYTGGQTSSVNLGLVAPIQSANLGGVTGWLMLMETPPQAVSVTPSSGSGASQVFSFVYSDSNAAAGIASAQAVINTAINGAGACWVWADPIHALLWLRNDGNSAWLGPITPGTSATLANSQCTVNASGSSLLSSGSTLTVNLGLAFLAAFDGTKNVYALAQNLEGLSSGWQALGTWTVNVSTQPPQPGPVTPASGSGSNQIFRFVYSDVNGASDIASTQVVVNTALNGTGACWVWMDPIHAMIWLRNDGNSAWLGPITLGASTTLQNSQCTVAAAASTAAFAGNMLTVNLSLTFLPAFSGAKMVFTQAQDGAGIASGWVQVGTWTVPTGSQPLQAVSVTPSSGSAGNQVFSLVYWDPNGTSDLASAQVVINTALNGTGACWVSVDPIHALISLRNDVNNAWLGPIALGASATIQNSQCTVTAASSTVVSSGNTTTVTLALAFTQAFDGAKNTYGQAQNAEGLVSGWQALGTWTVAVSNQPPQAVSVTPSSGSGSSQTFGLVYSDPNGASDLTSAQVVINTGLNGTGACWVSVDPIHALISLRNDVNSAWLGPIALGTSTTLQNSQCTVSAAKSTVVYSGNTLTVNLALAFTQAFGGAKNIYSQAQNAEGLASGWQPLGTWTP